MTEEKHFFKSSDHQTLKKVEILFLRLREFRKWQQRTKHNIKKCCDSFRQRAIQYILITSTSIIHQYKNSAIVIVNTLALLYISIYHLFPILLFEITEQSFESHVVPGVQGVYCCGALSIAILKSGVSTQKTCTRIDPGRKLNIYCTLGYGVVLSLFLFRAGTYVCVVEFIYLLSLSAFGYGLVKGGKKYWREVELVFDTDSV